MEYIRVIVDECGTIRAHVSALSKKEVKTCLAQHPEWRIICVAVDEPY